MITQKATNPIYIQWIELSVKNRGINYREIEVVVMMTYIRLTNDLSHRSSEGDLQLQEISGNKRCVRFMASSLFFLSSKQFMIWKPVSYS